MRNVKALGKFALVPGFVLVTAAIGSVAEAAGPGNPNASLRGSYAFTSARTCTVLNAPFAFGLAPLYTIPPALPPGALFRQSASIAGITVFNGDGTATSTGRSRVMNINATGGSPVSVSEFSSTTNYDVKPDGTVDTATSSTFTNVFPVPDLVPGLGMVTGEMGRLQIGHGKNVLVSAPSGDPAPETVVLPSGSVQTRFCVRSATLTKLGGN